MELKDYILMEVEGLKRNSSRVLDTLKQSEIAWRPASGCNSIGLILFHIARAEDSFVQTHLQKKPELFKSGKWYEKLDLPADEAGAHYNADQVNAFTVPELKELLAYHDAVRTATVEYLKGLSAADLDKKVTMPFFGDMSVAAVLSLITGHASQHIGEMSYLRGIQRGLDK
ncbi:MAG: DinB family protein [Dehalococcoidales bacterium]|nr:DinB family protein [Dehalococcoidales bacterium]